MLRPIPSIGTPRHNQTGQIGNTFTTNTRPLIGIPVAQDTYPPGQRPRSILYQTYTNALEAAGAAPVLLPIAERDTLDALLVRLDGLLIPGGDDVNPERYGAERHPKTEPPDDAHDAVEIYLTRKAVAERLPLLAICRGMQILNVALGGSLIQHIPDQVPNAIRHEFDYDDYTRRADVTHTVESVPGSRLAGIMGALQIGVNSFHHQAVERLAESLRAVACAPDGIIEAVEGGPGFVLGVQWHPEDMFEADAGMLGLFRAFVQQIMQSR